VLFILLALLCYSQQEFDELIGEWKTSEEDTKETPWKISESELLSQRDKVSVLIQSFAASCSSPIDIFANNVLL